MHFPRRVLPALFDIPIFHPSIHTVQEQNAGPSGTSARRSPGPCRLALALALLSTHLAFTTEAQVTQAWIQTYNGTGNGDDVANAMTLDSFGSAYVTGYSTINGRHRFTTIKYDASGEQEWVAVYADPGAYQYGNGGNDITVDDSGNVYVTGSSPAGGTEYTLDYVTIKYSASGEERWVARYDSPVQQQDIAFAVALDDNGNVYVTGQSAHPALNANIGTIKYNSAGQVQWVAEFDGTGNWDTGNDVVVDDSGNVYVAGFYSTDWGTAYLDFILLKYNPQGGQLWTQAYNGTANNSDIAVAVGLDGPGNVYITGYSTGTVYDIVTAKYSPSGVQQWSRTYSSTSPSIDVPSDMMIDEAGNVYISAAVSFDFGTLTYDTHGNLQWARRYDYNGNFDSAESIATDDEGNVYVTGVSGRAQTEASNDYATVKYSPAGDVLWVQRHDGAGGNWDEPRSIAVDQSGNVYVTGFSTVGGNYDFATIKYTQPLTGIHSAEIPDEHVLLQNYPNPFNPSTTFTFSIGHSAFVILRIYTLLGQEIATLVNKEMEPGSYKVDFDGTGLASGTYLCRLEAGGKTEIRKVVLVR